MRFDYEVRVPPSPCPGCGRMNDGASGGCQPKPGDFSVCISCGHIVVFAADMTTRDPTELEMMTIAGDENLIAIQKARSALLKEEEERKRRK